MEQRARSDGCAARKAAEKLGLKARINGGILPGKAFGVRIEEESSAEGK